MLISDGIMKDSKNNNGVFSIGYNTQKASVTVVSGCIVSWGCSAVGAKIGAFLILFVIVLFLGCTYTFP